MGEISRKLNDISRTIADVGIDPAALAGLIAAVDAGTINSTTAKDVFEKMWGTGRSAGEIIREEGLAQISDESAVLALVQSVVSAHADAVAQYRAGKTATFGFLVGQVMKSAGGKASPKLVNELLRRELA
jgi:aspartyl-tRNA(Asn)/glutamyl-tRNA(Gln) amidotransferase subunit B